MHGVGDLCWTGVEAPGEAVADDGPIGVEGVAFVIGARATGGSGVGVGDRREGAKDDVAVGGVARRFDQKDEAVHLVLDLFGLGLYWTSSVWACTGPLRSGLVLDLFGLGDLEW